MRADGKGVKQIDNWQPGLAIVDFTNPEAASWYAGKIKGLLDIGIDAIKTDFGERIPIDVKYYDGSDPIAMHNYYTYLYNKRSLQQLRKNAGVDRRYSLPEVPPQADSSFRFTGAETARQAIPLWQRHCMRDSHL